MTDDEKVIAFTRELTALSRKHGVFINGCGCCNSPFVYTDEKIECANFLAGYSYYMDIGSQLEWSAPFPGIDRNIPIFTENEVVIDPMHRDWVDEENGQ